MYGCLCDCVREKGQHPLGLGERSFKEVLFPDQMSKLGLRHTIHCHLANFVLGRYDWAKPQRGFPGPIQAFVRLVLPGIKLATPTSQVGEITKFSPKKAVDLLIWLGSKRH